MIANTTQTAPRAAIYVRVSDRKQEDNFSLSSQEAAIRAYCDTHGYTVVAVYREVRTGADFFTRPELKRLRDSVRRGEVDVVVAHHPDRITRDDANMGYLYSDWTHHNTRIETVLVEFDDTPIGALVRSAYAFKAKVERLDLIERTGRGMRERVEQGAPIAGCRPPYGYRWIDDVHPVTGLVTRPKARLAIDPVTGPVVERIARDILAGRALRAICLALDAEGAPTPSGRGARWHASTLVAIVKNPVCVGKPAAYRYRVEKQPDRRPRATKRPVDEHVALPDGIAPPLISEADAAAIAVRLATNKQTATRRNPNPDGALLRAGFIRCGYCGYGLSVDRAASPNAAYMSKGEAHRNHACPSFSIRVHALDRAVWQRVEAVIVRPEVVAEQVERLRQSDPVAADLASLARRLAEIDTAQQRTSRAIVTLDDDDASAPLLDQLTRLAAEKRRLLEDRTMLEGQRAGWEAAQARLDDIDRWRRRVVGNLPKLTYAEKRDLLTALDVHVTLYRMDHEPRWEISMGLDGTVSTTARGRGAHRFLRFAGTSALGNAPGRL